MLKQLVPALLFVVATPAFAKPKPKAEATKPEAAKPEAAKPAAAKPAAGPSVWEIDPGHSHVGFRVRHMMVSNVRGEFGKFSGSIKVDGSDLTKAMVEASIDVASINTRDEKRDGHLKSPDFFDAAKFPTITFKSKKIEKAKDGFKMVGDMTMHGVTKEVSFDVESLAPEAKNPYGMTVTGTTATTKINRKDFGVSWNKTLDSGGAVLGEEVQITLELELAKKMPAMPAAK